MNQITEVSLSWEHWKASGEGYRTQHFPKFLNSRTLFEYLFNNLPELPSTEHWLNGKVKRHLVKLNICASVFK